MSNDIRYSNIWYRFQDFLPETNKNIFTGGIIMFKYLFTIPQESNILPKIFLN